MASISSRFGLQKVLHCLVRFLQFVFAIAVIGLYAQDLVKARKVGKYADSKWAYAVAVGTLSAITALVYTVLLLLAASFTIAILFAWDSLLFILWVAVFGLFGSMYINEDPEMDAGVQRMKNAVWIDLVNMLLWFITTALGIIGFWKWRKGNRTLHTGRATV